MKVETYKCDVCGKQKGEVNHWLMMNNADIELKEGKILGGIAIHQWLEEFAKVEGFFHICGAECVQKKVNEFLSK